MSYFLRKITGIPCAGHGFHSTAGYSLVGLAQRMARKLAHPLDCTLSRPGFGLITDQYKKTRDLIELAPIFLKRSNPCSVYFFVDDTSGRGKHEITTT